MFHLSAPAITQAIAALELPPGSHGLDAGCGAGCHVDLLLDQVGRSGHLTALDASKKNLAWARVHHGQGRAVEWVTGDIRALAFADDSFSWVWCADTLWPGAVTDDPVTDLAGFSRVTRPGGTVALAYWSSQTLLSGYPALEARLNAAFVGTVPYLAGIPPALNFLRARSWLEKAGFEEVRAHTFVADIQPPLDQLTRKALAACYGMFWGSLRDRISAADQGLYERLSDLDSSTFIADDPGYHAFLTYTMFWGRVPARRPGGRPSSAYSTG